MLARDGRSALRAQERWTETAGAELSWATSLLCLLFARSLEEQTAADTAGMHI
jgi:hypothetical protein